MSLHDHNKMITALMRKGYGLLGSGVWATVMAKPGSDRVIKLCRDTTWEPYVVWAHRTGYAGRFAPYVHSLHRHEWGFVAVMERLDMTLCKAQASDNPKLRSLPGLDCFWGGNEPSDVLEEVNARYPGFKRFVRKVREAGFTGDWHGSNWMVKGEHRIVLTDPQGCDRSMVPARRWNARNVKELVAQAA